MSATTSDNTSSTRLGMRLAWARETLGVTDGSLAEVRQRMLRIVTDEDFVPPESVQQAFRTLEADAAGVAELDDPPAFAIDFERQLRQEVEGFAAGMFSLSISERKAMWDRLYPQSENCQRARTRLDQLRVGLAIDIAVLNDRPERTQELARLLCELLVQSPVQQSKRRSELVIGMEPCQKEWELAARELAAQHPAFIDLDRTLVGAICTRPAPPKPAQQLPPFKSKKPNPAWVYLLCIGIFLLLWCFKMFIDWAWPMP